MIEIEDVRVTMQDLLNSSGKPYEESEVIRLEYNRLLNLHGFAFLKELRAHPDATKNQKTCLSMMMMQYPEYHNL